MIRIQLTPLGLMEAGRIEFTKDYVLVVDRINKEYIKAIGLVGGCRFTQTGWLDNLPAE